MITGSNPSSTQVLINTFFCFYYHFFFCQYYYYILVFLQAVLRGLEKGGLVKGASEGA